jgi:hypothetical protein
VRHGVASSDPAHVPLLACQRPDPGLTTENRRILVVAVLRSWE